MKKNCMLVSSDGVKFEVEKSVAMMSTLVKNWLEDGNDIDIDNNGFLISTVNGRILAKVIEYCREHLKSHNKDVLERWDKEFMNVDLETLSDYILAARFLIIEDLYDLGCQTVADLIKGKTTGEIRKILHVVQDFAEGEAQSLHAAHKWASK